MLLCTKFRVNQTINRPDIAEKQYSLWLLSDKTIFKIAAVRHLEFSKFGIMIMCPVLEHDSALSYKISHLSDNHSLRYSQKTIFTMVAIHHFEFAKFWHFVK